MNDSKTNAASADIFECRTVEGKRVYIVDDHHKVLAAWAEERRRLGSPPNLITIDHHTDIYEAFSSHASCATWENPDADEEALRNALIGKIDWKDEQSVLAAIGLLKYDEHIHAATMSGILDAAFCIQLSDGDGTPLNEGEAGPAGANEELPVSNRIYVVPFKCAIGCQKPTYDDECKIHHAREIIETPYLDDQLARGAESARRIGMADMESSPYILDIDLDVFHSNRAAHPEDPSTFYRLIRNAIAITIATEAECVEELWHDESLVLTADDLREIVLGQIESALKT
jgi:hypothetical protein